MKETIVEEEHEINLRKARYDVLNFGISGFDKQKKDEARIEMLVKLGAKRPKNKYISYPQFLELKNAQKELERQRLETERSQGNYVKKQPGKKRKRDKDDIVKNLDIPVGKLRGGLLSVSKDEIDRIKKSKLKRM